MSVELGQVTNVVISSASAAKQVLQKQDLDFANRGVPDAFYACDHPEYSAVWLPLSPKWRVMRKLCNAHIFSYRKVQEMEHIRHQKVREMMEDVRKCALVGQAVLISETVFKTSFNLVSNILISVDLDQPDSELGREFKKSFMSILEVAGVPNLVDYFPWLKKFDFQRMRARMASRFSKMLSLVDSVIKQRLAMRAEHGSVSENKDVLDIFLNILQDSKEDITTNDINHLFLDLFVGGTDTVSVLLEWAMSELIKNPEIMSKAKNELARTIGKGKEVEDTDVERLPYLQAIVKEALRLHPVFPLLLPRTVLNDVKLCGYKIPKHTQVLINVWAIGRDPEIWDDPECFKPERFLGSEMDVKGGHYELLPFGGGRRICVGMPMAHKMMHLMLGSLINCFDWKLEGAVKCEDFNMDDKFGIALQKAQPLRALAVLVEGLKL